MTVLIPPNSYISGAEPSPDLVPRHALWVPKTSSVDRIATKRAGERRLAERRRTRPGREFCLVPMEMAIRIRSSLSCPDAPYHRRDDSPCDGRERGYATRVQRWAIRRPRGRPPRRWRAGFARAGKRSSWWTRCGHSDKHSCGRRSRAVKRLKGPDGRGAASPGRLGNCSWAE
jgi:hypothetical protein